MGRIQSSVGLVTGVAIEDTVNQLIQLSSLSRDRLVSRTDLLQREQVAVAELTAVVVGVQLSTDRLGQASLFSATTVNSSNSSALSATSTGSPQTGSYSFVPVRQAQSQQLTSSVLTSADQTLQAGEVTIHTGGFLDDSVNLDTLNAGQGVSRGFIKITDRSGNSQRVDLRFAQDINDVVEAINSQDDLGIVAGTSGDRLTLTDVTGSASGNLVVEEVSGGTTAADLGLSGIAAASSQVSGDSLLGLHEATALNQLLDGRGLDLPQDDVALEFQLQDGSTISFTSQLSSNTASLGQLIDELNEAGGGSFTASISSDGRSIEVQDLTSGSSTFAVTSPNGALAAQLGLDNTSVSGVITGNRLQSGLNDVLLSSLNGGQGLGTLGSLTITDRAGLADTIDLSAAETVHDVIDAINQSSVGVTAQLNQTRTGIELLDTTGSTAQDLVVANADSTNTATSLNIEGSFASDAIDSGSLNRQFVGRNTLLSDLNQGAGVSLGTIRFTDSDGLSSSLNLSSLQPTTLGEVIDAINGLAAGVEARINDAGDGLLIVDTGSGDGSLTVEDLGSSSAAAQLNIAGSGGELTSQGQTVTGIDGSQTIRISTDAETTLTSLAEQINALADSPVNANVLSLGTGGARLLLNGKQSGNIGRVAIETDIGISFSETSRAQDALLSFGGDDLNGGVLVSSSNNDFEGLIQDVRLTVDGVSDSPVTINISENNSGISRQIETFIDQYNSLRDKLAELTDFDEATQSVGLLFGSGAALRIDTTFSNFLSGQFRGAGSIGSLGQLGISLNEEGKLTFDQSKFNAAIEADPEAVQEFFTNEDSGFSVKAKAVADRLAGVDNGVLLNRSTALQAQIDQNNQRIGSMNLRLDRQRTRLLTQFYNMETTISRLQQNLTALNQLQIIPPLGSTTSSST